MSKKKSTKSTNEKITTLLIVLLCLIGSGVSLGFFARDFFQSLSKLNEEPIAQITYKHKTAQRKFRDRDVWDRLRQHSPLYNGDTVRTAPASETTIHFNDDDSIELLENSIVQIFDEDGEAVIDVENGGVIVKAGAKSKGFKVRLGDIATTVQPGSSLSAVKDGDTLVTNLNVMDGKAVMDTGEVLGKGNFFFEDGKKVANAPIITVTSPSPNEKILNLGGGKMPVQFKWNVQNLSSTDELVLDIAHQRDFEDAAQHALGNATSSSITLELDGQSAYWRIYPKQFGKKFQTKGKITFIEGTKQKLIIPEDDYQETFRTVLPSVRFLWEENEWASGYFLEISPSPAFSNNAVEFLTNENFAIISSLSEGIWYWRVTPEFKSGTIRNTKLTSDARSFEIIKDTNIEKPRLISPLDDSLIQKNEHEPVVFSWKPGEEGDMYTIQIAKDGDFTDMVLEADTAENHFETELDEGDYFWSVTVTGKDGKKKSSDTRSFSVKLDSFTQRLIFPPDGYIVEQDRLKDVSFVWKTSGNDKSLTELQVSDTPSFSSILRAENTGKSEASIDWLDSGTYYWRIKTDSERGEEYSESRSFIVKERLKAPDTVFPQGNIKIGIDKKNPVHFEWEPIEDADSYKFRLYKSSDMNTPVYEKNNVLSNSLDIDLAPFGDGDYVWTVQANAMEKDGATRFTGELSEHEFSARTVKRVTLISPAEKSFVEGTRNYIRGTDFKWDSAEDTDSTILRIFKNGKLVREIKNPKKSVTVKNLEAGKYSWTVEATAKSDGLDISPAKAVTFTIEAFRPLARPVLSTPKDKTDFAARELKKMDSIEFSWSAVKDANVYIVTIKDSSGRTVLSQNVGNTTTFNFKSLTSLSRGTFTWSVEARQVSKNETLRTSSSSPFEFVINIPVLDELKLEDAGELYGF